MRAIVQDEYGPYAQVLRATQIATPVAGPGEVLVRVRATSVHADVGTPSPGFPYVLRLMGSGLPTPKQPVPGTDLAGEVVRVGPGATRFAPATGSSARSRRPTSGATRAHSPSSLP